MQRVLAPDEPVGTAFREALSQRAGAAGITLEPYQLGHLDHYFRLLSQWNSTINLTGLPLSDFPDRTLDRLFIEPLQAARVVEDSALIWFDLGSGGGTPAIPLKIARPQLRLTMVESKSRKSAFLTEVVRSLGLTATDVLTIRIEELPRSVATNHADLITIRAVRIQKDLLQTVRALLRPGGRLLLFGSEPEHQLGLDDRGFRMTDQLTLVGGDSTLRVLSKMA